MDAWSLGISAWCGQGPRFGLQQAIGRDYAPEPFGVAAGLMMLWLAWQGWRSQDDGAAPAGAVGRTRRQALFAGIALNLVNVKAALFFVTVAPRFLSGPDAPAREFVMLGMISVGVATLAHLGLVLGAAGLRRWWLRPGRVAIIRRVLALGMAAVGVWFITTALH